MKRMIPCLFIALALIITPWLASPVMAQENIAVIQDLANSVLIGPKNGAITMKNAANAFYATGQPDDFDFLFVFMQVNPTLEDEGYLPTAYPVQAAPAGTNAPIPPEGPAAYGSAGKLKLVGDMYSISNYGNEYGDPYKYYTWGIVSDNSAYSGLGMVGRAMMRYWGAYLQLPGGNTSMLSGTGYWSFFLNTSEDIGGTLASVLGGNSIKRLSNDYTIYDVSHFLSPLDRYLMGMIDADDIDEDVLFYLSDVNSDPTFRPDSYPVDGGTYISSATKNEFTMADVISANGAIAEGSQKDFRCAFALFVPAGASALPTDLSKIENIRKRFQGWFNEQTNNLGTMDCTLEGGGTDGDVDGDYDQSGCREGEKRCNRNWVEVCNSSGSWIFLEDCRDLLCDDTIGECVEEIDGDGGHECEVGDERCNGDFVQRCDNNQWFDFQDCSMMSKVCHEAECVNPSEVDGDTSVDGDMSTDGDVGPLGCVSEADCPANHRCTTNGSCEPCPVGTTLKGNVCFTDDSGEEDEEGGGGCSSTDATALWLLLALFSTILIRRRSA